MSIAKVCGDYVLKLRLVYPAWCDEFGDFVGVAKGASSFPPLNLFIVAATAGWEV